MLKKKKDMWFPSVSESSSMPQSDSGQSLSLYFFFSEASALLIVILARDGSHRALFFFSFLFFPVRGQSCPYRTSYTNGKTDAERERENAVWDGDPEEGRSDQIGSDRNPIDPSQRNVARVQQQKTCRPFSFFL